MSLLTLAFIAIILSVLFNALLGLAKRERPWWQRWLLFGCRVFGIIAGIILAAVWVRLQPPLDPNLSFGLGLVILFVPMVLGDLVGKWALRAHPVEKAGP